MNLRSTFWLALLAGLVCPVTAADGSLEAPEHGYVEVVAHDVPFAVGIELGGMAGDDHLQYRLGYALIAHEDMQEFFYTGPVIGARLYSNDDITPFVGISGFLGWYEQEIKAEDDYIDNDNDGSVDERGETKSEVADVVLAVIPEVTSRCCFQQSLPERHQRAE